MKPENEDDFQRVLLVKPENESGSNLKMRLFFIDEMRDEEIAYVSTKEFTI